MADEKVPRKRPERDYLLIVVDLIKSVAVPVSIFTGGYYLQKSLASSQLETQTFIAHQQNESEQLTLALSVFKDPNSPASLKKLLI